MLAAEHAIFSNALDKWIHANVKFSIDSTAPDCIVLNILDKYVRAIKSSTAYYAHLSRAVAEQGYPAEGERYMIYSRIYGLIAKAGDQIRTELN